MSFGKGGLRTRQVACGAVGIMGEQEESRGGEKKKWWDRPAAHPQHNLLKLEGGCEAMAEGESIMASLYPSGPQFTWPASSSSSFLPPSENKLRRTGRRRGGGGGRVGQGLFKALDPAQRLNHMQSFSKLKIISLSSLNEVNSTSKVNDQEHALWLCQLLEHVCEWVLLKKGWLVRMTIPMSF